MSSASNVLSGTDEAVGRVIVATLAWGAAPKLLVTRPNLLTRIHLSCQVRERMQRVPRWSEQAT